MSLSGRPAADAADERIAAAAVCMPGPLYLVQLFGEWCHAASSQKRLWRCAVAPRIRPEQIWQTSLCPPRALARRTLLPNRQAFLGHHSGGWWEIHCPFFWQFRLGRYPDSTAHSATILLKRAANNEQELMSNRVRADQRHSVPRTGSHRYLEPGSRRSSGYTWFLRNARILQKCRAGGCLVRLCTSGSSLPEDEPQRRTSLPSTCHSQP